MSGFSDQRGLWGRQNRKGEKKQVGCEKGITPQRRRLRVIMDEGAQNGERKGRGFFRHQVRSRLFFIFFDLYFFFFCFVFVAIYGTRPLGLSICPFASCL